MFADGEESKFGRKCSAITEIVSEGVENEEKVELYKSTGYAVEVLFRLQALGVKILLDDFGTGLMRFAYLARLPLNKVKIDKSFVAPLGKDSVSRAVTNAMIMLGRTLDLEVVAEGVETERALDYIRAQGCIQAQGYYFRQPMSGDAFEDWYWERRHRQENTGSGLTQHH